MAVCSAFDAFAFATEHLTRDLFLRALPQGYMLNLIPRDEYPMDAGFVLTSYTFGRIAPLVDERVWAPITLQQPGSGTCGANWTDITGGWNSRTWGPTALDLRGEVICEDDLIFGHMTDVFLERYIEALAKESRMEIENQLLAQYMYTVNLMVPASGVLGEYAPGAAVPAATSDLQQAHLDYLAAELNLEGANTPNSNGWIDLGMAGPRYSLLCGQQVSMRLYLNNSEFREDIRFADQGKGTEGEARAMLLRNMGSTLAIKNFRHMITVIPPRFTWNAGTQSYNRVNTYIGQSATKGTIATINPAYLTAPYEGAVVLNPFVLKEWLIKPVLASAGVAWDYKSYFGEWLWKTGGMEIIDPAGGAPCYDPWKKLGRHFAQYKHALEPVIPQYGKLIIYRNCADYNAVPDVTCS